jgi:hypothetical protein
VNGVAKLAEIEQHWSFEDLLDANEALELQALANEEATGK